MRVGRSVYQVEQLYSSQSSQNNVKELLFKVALKSPDSGQEYKVDIQHRVRWQ